MKVTLLQCCPYSGEVIVSLNLGLLVVALMVIDQRTRTWTATVQCPQGGFAMTGEF